MVEEDDDIEEVIVEPETETRIPVLTEAASDDTDLDDLFAEPERSGYSLPLPAIAGAIGLVVMICAGIWYSMSGPAEQPKPAQAQVAQPAPAEPSPTVETTLGTSDTTGSQPETTVVSSELPSDQQTAAVKTNQPRPKKADPAKTEKKKAVTVDDLINDN